MQFTVHWWYAIAAAFLLSVLVALSVNASQSTITQEIVSEECGATSYDTGIGQVHQSFCEPFTPSVTRVEVSPGRIVFYGAFDAVNTRMNVSLGQRDLRVTVAGITYVLGVNPELQADGNAWWLDISERYNELDTGDIRTVRVVVTTTDDEVIEATETFQVGEPEQSLLPSLPTFPTFPELAETGLNQLIILGSGALLFGGSLAVLARLVYIRRKRRTHE